MKSVRERLGVVGLVVLTLVLVPLLLLSLPFLAAGTVLDLTKKARVRRAAPKKWGGKRILLVYSDSPNWKEYIEARWLPRFGDALVTLNWTRRRMWATESRFERGVFQLWAGNKEFNPMVIAFPEKGPVKVIRFWQPFRDYKHGREATLMRAEAEFESLVQQLGTHADQP